MESFNGKRRDEPLKRESFDTLLEAKVLIERWRQRLQPPSGRTVPWVPSPDPGGTAALCRRYGYASATAQGWSIAG